MEDLVEEKDMPKGYLIDFRLRSANGNMLLW